MNAIENELKHMKNLEKQIIYQISYNLNSSIRIIDQKYFNLYSKLIDFQLNDPEKLKKISNNRIIGENFLFLKRIYLDDSNSIDSLLYLIELYIIEKFSQKTNSLNIIAYRTKPLIIEDKKNNTIIKMKLIEILYQDEFDMIILYPIIEKNFQYLIQDHTNMEESNNIFEKISDFILSFRGNFIERINSFYSKLQLQYKIEKSNKIYRIFFDLEEDLNEFIFVNKFRMYYDSIQKMILNDLSFDHYEKIWMLDCLGKIYYQLHYDKESKSIWEFCLEKSKDLFGEGHYETIRFLYKLGIILEKEKNYDLSLEYLLVVKKKLEKIYFESDCIILRVNYNIATLYKKKGNSLKALKIYKKIENIIFQVYINIPWFIFNDSMLGLGVTLFQLKKYKESILYFQNIYDFYSLIHGKYFLKTVNILNNIAICYSKCGGMVQYYVIKLQIYINQRSHKGDERAKKSECDEILKNQFKISSFLYSSYAIRKMRVVYKRKLIIEEILTKFI